MGAIAVVMAVMGTTAQAGPERAFCYGGAVVMGVAACIVEMIKIDYIRGRR